MTSSPGLMPIAFSAAWMATVPVLTHWPYFAVCTCANFAAKAAACFPGNGCPPHRVLSSTYLSAAASVFVAIGHCGSDFFRRGFPPVIASFPTAIPPIQVRTVLERGACKRSRCDSSLGVGIRQQNVPHDGVQIVAHRDELPQTAPGGRKRVTAEGSRLSQDFLRHCSCKAQSCPVAREKPLQSLFMSPPSAPGSPLQAVSVCATSPRQPRWPALLIRPRRSHPRACPEAGSAQNLVLRPSKHRRIGSKNDPSGFAYYP